MQNHSNAEENLSPRTTAFTRLVYVVFGLNLLALLLFVAGLIAGWFWPEATLIRDGAYRLSLVINTAEASDDMHEVAKTTQNIAGTGASIASLDTVQGKIVSVDPASDTFSIDDEGNDYKLKVTEITEFDADGKSELSALEIGDSVSVTIRKKDDQYYAIRIASVKE